MRDVDLDRIDLLARIIRLRRVAVMALRVRYVPSPENLAKLRSALAVCGHSDLGDGTCPAASVVERVAPGRIEVRDCATGEVSNLLSEPDKEC